MAKKWIRDSEWMRRPHGKEPVPSLWWYRRPDRNRVIDAYLDQCKRGRALPNNFKDSLLTWLDGLNRYQNLKAWGNPRTWRYWTIPAYALANRIKKAALMKRLREMERIAKQLFPDSVPTSRKTRTRLSDEEIREIQQQCLDGKDIKQIAEEFRIPASQVGHLCREQKAMRAAERERLISEHMEQTRNESSLSATDETDCPF